MRAAVLAAVTVPLAGCFDLSFDFEGQSIAIASRDFRLTIAGCASDGLLGCADTAETGAKMEAVLDGKTHVVPIYEPAPFELFSNRGFQLIVPSPEDPDVKVILNGQGVHVEELPWFDLELARPGTVRRSAGAVRLVFDPFPAADVTAALTSRCANTETFEQTPEAPVVIGDGVVDVTLENPRLDGDCTHELRLTQTVRVENEIDVTLTSARTVHQVFASAR